MKLADRVVRLVTEHSGVVVVLMLLLSAGIGMGMTSIEDEAGLSQFQFGSEEADALDYIGANFESGGEETTNVQIVVTDDENVLTRESLVSTLRLQSELRADEEINRTLSNDRAFADLAGVVATAAVRQERAAELQERQDELEAAGAELEADQEELEAASAELESRQAELEADQEELEAASAELESRQAELEETGQTLSDILNQTRTFQEQFLALNASFESGETSQTEYARRSDRISNDLETVAAPARRLLDDDSYQAYESLRQEIRQLTREIAAVERRYQRGELSERERDQQFATLETEIGAVYEEIRGTVLADELAALEERGAELEQRAEDLEQRGEELQQRGQELEQRGEELEQRGQELQERRADLEAEFGAIQDIDPTLEEQLETLESMDDDEFDEVIGTVLGEDAPRELLAFVPTDYELGSGQIDARQLFVTQTTDEEIVEGAAPPEIEESQLAIADHVDERFGDDAFVFGAGIITDEQNRSMADSLALVLPLALVFVLIVLSIAYRDPLDILLGMFGIALVLIWTFGFMGWTGIAFNQIMIAVPVLLVGLSIDYAIHVFMRHREQRMNGHDGPRVSMNVALLGLGAALLWVTITAVIGFLSNLVSPVAPIREFGIVSAFGIASTLLIFGTLIPAMKVSLDAFLEARGWDRKKRAFGTEGGLFTTVLSGGYGAARRMPVVVLVLVLLITAAGAYGATQVDTTFQQEDFIAGDPPEWMDSLPEAMAPGEYSVKSNLAFVNERFLRQDSTAQVLIRGDVTTDDTLTDIDTASGIARELDVIVTLSDGEADVRSPLSVMEQVAAEDEEFANTFEAADTTGDGVPDRNIAGVYDALFEAAPDEASDVIYRTDDGEYEATRLVLSIKGDAIAADATDATREVSAAVDRSDRPAIATGQVVVFNIVEDELFNTVLESLVVTMISVFLFLMIAYRFVHGSALLGAVTLTPILLTVAWILGTMFLLGISFNVLTGTITSLTIGLGVAYNIHMTERYRLELTRGQNVWSALKRAVTGTGGALLGSAATTAGGFGVLSLAILPPLQQFGLITGITIIYAFLGSVFVLPSFLVLWTRYLGPAEQFPDSDTTTRDVEPATTDATGEQTTGASDDGPSSVVTEYDPPSSKPGYRAGDDGTGSPVDSHNPPDSED